MTIFLVRVFKPNKFLPDMKKRNLGYLGFLGLLGLLGMLPDMAGLYGLFGLFALFSFFGYADDSSGRKDDEES